MSQKKNEGILFPTEIRVVGSYTDRLLNAKGFLNIFLMFGLKWWTPEFKCLDDNYIVLCFIPWNYIAKCVEIKLAERFRFFLWQAHYVVHLLYWNLFVQ